MQPRNWPFSDSVTKVARHDESAGDFGFTLGALRLAAVPGRLAERGHAGREQKFAIGLGEPRRGGIFERESAVADDPRRVRADVGRSRQMQAAYAHVALGGDIERAPDGQEAAGSAPVERLCVQRLNPSGGVGVDRFGGSSIEEMREVGGNSDDRLGAAPDGAQRRGDIMRSGVADEDRNDLERGRQHRLEHHEMHFERMLAGERPGIDEDARRPGELGVRNRRDLRFAQRRPPFHRRMDRDPAEGDPVGRTDDHDAARRLGALRPRTEGARRDRAGINEAGMGRDHDLRRDAGAARALADRSDQSVQRLRRRRVEHPRHLRGMDFVCRHGHARNNGLHKI